MPKIIKNGVSYAGIPAINYDCEVSEITLYAANWNTTTNIYTISDARIDPTSVQEYLPAMGITDDQLGSLQAANICDNGQDNGHAYLKAYGTVPSIDIPIRIMFNPGVKTKETDKDWTQLYKGSGTHTGNITLSQPYTNFKEIMFVYVRNASQVLWDYSVQIVPTFLLEGIRNNNYLSGRTNRLMLAHYDDNYTRYGVTSTTVLTHIEDKYISIVAVYGR